LRVRMGLHQGLAEPRGADYAVTHTLNRVARVMSAGHGGQVLVSLAVAEAVRDRLPEGVSLRDLGQHRLKGLSHAEHLLQVVARDLPANFPPLKSTPVTAAPGGEATSLIDRIVRGQLVGREAELAEALALWQRAVTGEVGEARALLVSGEPGVGKTRFVQEVIAQARGSGAAVLTGECYAEGSAPYAPVAQMIRQALEDLSPGGLDLPDFVLADLLTLAPGLRSRYPDIPPNSPLDPQTELERVYDNVVELCARLAARAPLLLFLDDAHWADPGTLFLLRHLARRRRTTQALRALPLLIVMTYREVELHEARALHEVLLDLNRERLSARIKLARLSKAQTRDLLAAMFAEEITNDFLEGIYRETEGNPFFVEEVCKALVESGKLSFADGRWRRPSDMAEMEIPQSVRLAIQARVARLPGPAQDVLRLAGNLAEELGYGDDRGAPHSQIYAEMLKTFGISLAKHATYPETQNLIDTMLMLCRQPGGLAGLGALCLGGEAVVPALYTRIIDGFRSCGVGVERLRFFAIHVECDDGHADTMYEIIARKIGHSESSGISTLNAGEIVVNARLRFFDALLKELH